MFSQVPQVPQESSVIFLLTIPFFIWVMLSFLGFRQLLVGDFFGIFLLFLVLSFYTFILISSSAFSFVLFLEACTFLIILLIFWLSKDSDKVFSAHIIIFFNIIGSIPFFFFFFLRSRNLFSSLSLQDLVRRRVIHLGALTLLLLRKLPIFFMHFWLTKAHVSASGACSMVLAGLTLKLGGFGILKYCFSWHPLYVSIGSFLFSIAALGTLMFRFLIVRFFDFKYFVARSSVVHISLIFPLYSIGSSVGSFSCVRIMVGHGLISSFMFLLVTLIYESGQNRTFDFGGSLGRVSKSLSFCLAFWFFANMGVPPLVSFLREVFSVYAVFCFSWNVLFFFFCCILLSCLFLMFCLTKIFFCKKNRAYGLETINSLTGSLTFFLPCLIFLPLFLNCSFSLF